MPAIDLVHTTLGPVNVVTERVLHPEDWDGANFVTFFRHKEKLHVAFAYDGYEKLIDALREHRWVVHHPILVGKYVADWMDNEKYKK